MSYPILAPVVGMMALTLIVWLTAASRRVGYIMRHRIHPQRVATPEQIAELLPMTVNSAFNNFRNLCELPVLFYAACLALAMLGVNDIPTLALAWAFVIGRGVHSAIHCTANIVKWRFYAYAASSLLLWGLVLRLAWAVATAA